MENFLNNTSKSDYDAWLNKIEKYTNKEKTMVEFPKRGDIWTLDFGHGIGSEMLGIRPVVVLSSSLTNEKSNTLLVLPIARGAENPDDDMPFHLHITPDILAWGANKVDGVIKTESIYTKSRGRIGKRIGRLNDEGIDKVTELVSKVLYIREPVSPAEDLQKVFERQARRRGETANEM